jgi:penicillin-binding protein 1C
MKCSGRWHALFAGVVLGLTVSTTHAAVPRYEHVRTAWLSSDVTILDRHGEPLQRVRRDYAARRGEWVALADVSPALRTAIVLSEDRRFYAHSGVDWRGVAAAAWGNLWNTRTRGASTLTMQLAGLLDEDLRVIAGGRTLTQKIGQAIDAKSLERNWRKDQILEAYLNLVPFRGEMVGIAALSHTLFGKYPSGLDSREAAVAAALLRGPNAAATRVAQRACAILKSMDEANLCRGLDGFVQLAFARPASLPALGTQLNLAPHLGRRLAQDAPALASTIQSTLDARIQRVAQASLSRHLQVLAKRNVQDGAVVVLDNASGQVLAWVGSSGALSGAAQVDHALALRQAGSTLKPFLYAQAFEERRLTPASLLDDTPVNLPTGGGLYVPQNYDRRYSGWVSTRTALGSSLNIPAVRTLVMVTPHRFHQRLLQLGLPLPQSGDYYGYSLALGSADVPLAGLTNAYRALANGGRYTPWSTTPHAEEETTPSTRRKTAQAVSPLMPASNPTPMGRTANGRAINVFDSRAAWMVGDILSDRHARTRAFGLDSPLTTRFWSAVKTGTSKDMRDNWCLGWSERYTVGVWIGNTGGSSMWDVSGIDGAAPVWHEVMSALHAHSKSQPPVMPNGISRVFISFGASTPGGGPLEPAREEIFLSGTEHTTIVPSTPAPSTTRADPTILAPADGTVLALDPDIPPRNQRVWLRATALGGLSSSQAKTLRWSVGGKPAGRGAEVSWLPWPGRHEIKLTDAQGRILASRHIEVRGATVRSQ